MKDKFIMPTDIHEGKKLIDNISLLGGELHLLKMRGQDVTQAKEYLSVIDSICQKYWDAIKVQQNEYNTALNSTHASNNS